MHKAILLTLILMSAMLATDGDLNYYVWPNSFQLTTKHSIIFVLTFSNYSIACNKPSCGAEDSHMDILSSEFYELYGNQVEILKAKMTMDACPTEKSKLSFSIEESTFTFDRHQEAGATSEFDTEHSITVPVCPRNFHKFSYKMPCWPSAFGNLCREGFICQGRFQEDRPDYISIENDRTVIMNRNHECKAIYYRNVEYSCDTEMKLTERLVAKEHPETWCKVKTAIVSGVDKITIQVPFRIGGQVCVQWEIEGKFDESCKVAISKHQEFTLPLKVKKIRVVCDGQEFTQFSQERRDISCPLIGFNQNLAKRVCQSTWRPMMFWFSVFWLIFGLPVSWFFVHMLFKIKHWCHFRQLQRVPKGHKCFFCQQHIHTGIDARDHERCDDNICPYCEKIRVSQKDLQYHAARCDKKELQMDKLKEILKRESFQFRDMHNSYRTYSKPCFRSFWVLLFLLIFISMFVPSISMSSRGCERLRSCEEAIKEAASGHCSRSARHHSYIRHDHGRHMVVNNPAPAPRDEIQPTIQAPTLEKETDEHLTMTRDIIVEITKAKMALEAVMDKFEKQLTSDLTERLDNLEDEIRRVGKWVDDEVDKHYCNEFFKEKVLGRDLHTGQDIVIKIHIDDERKFNNYVSQSSISSLNPELKHFGEKSVNVGQDAAAQVGGSHQYMQGGSGGSNQFSLGGSANAKDFNGPVAPQPVNFAEILNREIESTKMRVENEERERERIRSHRSKRELVDHLNDKLEEDANKLLATKYKLKIDREVSEFDKNSKLQSPLLDNIFSVKQFEDIMNGIKIKGSHKTLSNKDSIMKQNLKNKPKITSDYWHEFHPESEAICGKNCLHEPETCECLTNNLPKSGRYSLPWTSLAISDVHFSVNPNHYEIATTTVDFEAEKTLTLKTNIHAKVDVHEGSHVTWKLINEKSETSPTISIVIPEISQIYATSFLYYTCEREIDTEVKGLCTGYCGSYCEGRVCVGTRVWKWENCRNPGCNPSWCWSSDTGCCCCGANVYCPSDAKLAAVWQVKYLRTEILLCAIYNDKLQNCRLTSETGEMSFGDLSVGVTRALGPSDTLPKLIMTTHMPVGSIGGSAFPVNGYFEADDAYMDPPVCQSEAVCNHGFIGDLQVNNITCFEKLGKACYKSDSELLATDCAHQVYMSHSDSRMKMTCHFGQHHSCEHEHAVKKLRFDDHLHSTEKISTKFNIKKLKTNLASKELLIFVSPKQIAGTIDLDIQMKGITVTKKDHPPTIIDFKVANCKGCYSCKLGFYCEILVEQDEMDSVILNIVSENDIIDMNRAPVTINRGHTSTKVWGVAYDKTDKIDLCLSFGQKCLKRSRAKINLKEPTGQFVPVFDDTGAIGIDGDKNACEGFKWFSCVSESISKFAENMWSFFKGHFMYIVLFFILVISIMLLPYIFFFLNSIFHYCFTRRRAAGRYYKGPGTSAIHKSTTTKMKKLKDSKNSDDDEEDESMALLITSTV